MVTLLCLLEHHEILIEKGLLREGYSVDSGKLLTLLIASPVCSGDGCELHRLDHRGIAEMRSAAEIGKTSVLVEGNLAVLQFVNQFNLVFVPLLIEIFESIRLCHVSALERLPGMGELEHLLLDGREIIVGKDLVTKVDVIVESVLKSRSDSELHARIKGLEGLCHEMRRRMPENVLSFRIIPFEQPDAAVLHNRGVKSDDISLAHCRIIVGFHRDSQNIGCQPRADAFRNLITCYSFLEGPDASVRKSDVNHHLKKLKTQ